MAENDVFTKIIKIFSGERPEGDLPDSPSPTEELFAPGHGSEEIIVDNESHVEPPPTIDLMTIEHPDGNGGKDKVLLVPPPSMTRVDIPAPPGTEFIIREVPPVSEE